MRRNASARQKTRMSSGTPSTCRQTAVSADRRTTRRKSDWRMLAHSLPPDVLKRRRVEHSAVAFKIALAPECHTRQKTDQIARTIPEVGGAIPGSLLLRTERGAHQENFPLPSPLRNDGAQFVECLLHLLRAPVVPGPAMRAVQQLMPLREAFHARKRTAARCGSCSGAAYPSGCRAREAHPAPHRRGMRRLRRGRPCRRSRTPP